MFAKIARRFAARPRRQTSARIGFEALEGKALLTTLPLSFGATVTSPPVAFNGELFFSATNATNGGRAVEERRHGRRHMMVADVNPARAARRPAR